MGNAKPDKQVLLEQYKTYVQTAENVSARRAQTNVFYTTLLSALLALLATISKDCPTERARAIVILVGAFFGMFLCLVWWANLYSYRRLNSAKFKLIHRLEKHLAADLFHDEWEILTRCTAGKRYRRLSKVEQFVPLTLFALYILLAGYGIYALGCPAAKRCGSAQAVPSTPSRSVVTSPTKPKPSRNSGAPKLGKP